LIIKGKIHYPLSLVAWARTTVTNYNISKRGLKQVLKSS
jgi:hypothetical protein